MHSCNTIPKQKAKALGIIKFLSEAAILKHKENPKPYQKIRSFLYM
jgi:hypothetical protein